MHRARVRPRFPRAGAPARRPEAERAKSFGNPQPATNTFSQDSPQMKTAEVISQGSLQTVRLPEDCLIDGGEVFVKRLGRSLLLIPKDADPWQMLVDSLGQFTEDYMEDRNQPKGQDRETPFV